jgi:geranylgeranyl diphosphate synthase type 3
MYFRALQELSKLGAGEEAVNIYTEELLALHRGQGMDLFWRDTGTVPKTEDYLRMVANSTLPFTSRETPLQMLIV